MTREIKFRAWNENTKKMIDLLKITPLALDPTLITDGLFLPFSDELILMQFTGLRDKNGKEIYEGDVLSTEADPPRICEIKYDDKFGAFMVGWQPHAFYSKLAEYAYFNNDEIKVIGNIHENPELVK